LIYNDPLKEDYMSSENPVFQAIEETREILGADWKKHWLTVLKPKTIAAYILWLGEKEDSED
jgi:hypothetical protein